jgi:hypothetical protein
MGWCEIIANHVRWTVFLIGFVAGLLMQTVTEWIGRKLFPLPEDRRDAEFKKYVRREYGGRDKNHSDR